MEGWGGGWGVEREGRTEMKSESNVNYFCAISRFTFCKYFSFSSGYLFAVQSSDESAR